MPSKSRAKQPSPSPSLSASADEADSITTPDAPTSIDPYAILNLTNEATEDEVKRAYRRAALVHHPDKAAPADKDTAHTKFQEIAFAYAILSDERRRKRYDTTGSTEEILEGEDGDFSWADFYREQFADVVTEATITQFADKYKGSEEERGDILAAYTKVEGDMGRLYGLVMLSEPDEDEERFRVVIQKAIEAGEVEEFEKFTDESEKKRAARMQRGKKQRLKDAKEAAEMREGLEKTEKTKGKKKDAGMGDLAALIQGKQAGRAENFFDGLEAKYAPKGKKGGNKRASPDDGPSEEAFAKNQQKRTKR